MHNVSLLVLTSPGCTHCQHFLEFWQTQKDEWRNVTMREVSVLTEEGQSLAREHGVFASPGIILNGELFSSGGYDELEFLGELESHSKDHS
jgi:glutaredoxin